MKLFQKDRFKRSLVVSIIRTTTSTVAYPGRSPGAPAPPLSLDENEARRAPSWSQCLDDRPPLIWRSGSATDQLQKLFLVSTNSMYLKERCWFLSRGGVLRLIFAGYVPLASQRLNPIIVYSMANYRPHPSHFWACKCNFRDPNLVTFYLCIYLINPLLLKWIGHAYSTKILVRLLTVSMKNFPTPKIRKCSTPF